MKFDPGSIVCPDKDCNHISTHPSNKTMPTASTTHHPARQFFLIIGAVLGWAALIGQLYLTIVNRQASLSETLVRFISYFTILSNILVALAYTYLWLSPSSKWGQYFSKTTTLTALAVYIGVTGLVYNTILRFQWSPTGFQYVVDQSLHTIVPILFLGFWSWFVPKTSLKWTDIFPWMIFPALYCVYTLIRGNFFDFYPYPFMDVNKHGMQQTIVNCLIVTVVFVVISLILVGIGFIQKRRITL